jgi:transposase InsO family protein
VARKREVVLRLLRGESVELLPRELGVPIFKLEQWRQKADAAPDGALKEREADATSIELDATMKRIDEDSHDRQIITEAPNVMWAIDTTQITTVQHGKVWLFGVAEHWNAEFLGWHVTKRGTRFEATQALSMAVRQQFGHLSAGAARGLALRHDHAGVPKPLAAWGGGSAFMADHFQNQVRFRGISPSCAFVGERCRRGGGGNFGAASSLAIRSHESRR